MILNDLSLEQCFEGRRGCVRVLDVWKDVCKSGESAQRREETVFLF